MSFLWPYHWEMLWASLKSDCQGNLWWLSFSESGDCAKCVRVQAGLHVSNSDRLFGGHPSKSHQSKDLQDGPQIMALGNDPKQD